MMLLEVPGSVLGPLLFVLCTNPLRSVIRNIKFISRASPLYANDILNFSYRFLLLIYLTISLILKTPNIYNSISPDSHSLSIHLKLSFLSLVFHNSRSSYVLLFIHLIMPHSPCLSHPSIHPPHNVILTSVNCAHNFGVIFDKHLTLPS